jgi:hypothetical protein
MVDVGKLRLLSEMKQPSEPEHFNFLKLAKLSCFIHSFNGSAIPQKKEGKPFAVARKLLSYFSIFRLRFASQSVINFH